MKKVFLALIVVAVGLVATAQHVPPLDTLRGPDPTYFYPAHFWSHTINRDGPFLSSIGVLMEVVIQPSPMVATATLRYGLWGLRWRQDRTRIRTPNTRTAF